MSIHSQPVKSNITNNTSLVVYGSPEISLLRAAAAVAGLALIAAAAGSRTAWTTPDGARPAPRASHPCLGSTDEVGSPSGNGRGRDQETLIMQVLLEPRIASHLQHLIGQSKSHIQG